MCGGSGTLFVIDTATNRVIDEVPTIGANTVLVDANDRILISRSNRQVAVFDPETHEIGATATVGEAPDEMAMTSEFTVDELLLAIDIALGQELTTCSGADANRDGSVTVDEIVLGVEKALVGCH